MTNRKHLIAITIIKSNSIGGLLETIIKEFHKRIIESSGEVPKSSGEASTPKVTVSEDTKTET